MTIPLKDSTAPNAKAALARLEQLKGQLNLTPSTMSLQGPKDMSAERAAADFSINALARLWAGGDKQYEMQVKNQNPTACTSKLVFFINLMPMNQ